MDKKIEIINASDPILLKQQLEQMVNVGWKIMEVINHNPHDNNSEPFVILERDSTDDPTVEESLYSNEIPVSQQQYYVKPEPPRKEISISMG